MDTEIMLRNALLLIPLAYAVTAIGTDAEDRTYPLDDVPACMQRDENGAAIRCVLRGSGVWEQLIPPNVDDPNEPAAGLPAMRPKKFTVTPIETANVIVEPVFCWHEGFRMSLPSDVPGVTCSLYA